MWSIRRISLSALLVISAFGPYLTSSIRTEHLVLYPAALTALYVIARQVGSLGWFLPRLPSQVALAFVLILVVALLSTVLAYPVAGARIFSQLDNWLQPIAICLLAIAYGPQLGGGLPWIVGLLGANGALQIYQGMTGNLTIVAPFISVSDTGASVAASSAELGRYLGVFNQPFEAGVAFGVAILLWLYLQRTGARGFWFNVALLLMFAGGLMTVSKVFLFIALPLFAVSIIWERVRGPALSWSGVRQVVGFTAAILIGGSLLLQYWDGAKYLLRFFGDQGDKSWLEVLTAGRVGYRDSQLLTSLRETWAEEPLFGYGLKGVEIVDNGFYDAYVQAGLAGVLFFSAIPLSITVKGLRSRHSLAGRTLVLLGFFGAAASFGAPALTINRASILLWVTIFALWAALPKVVKTEEVDLDERHPTPVSYD